MPDSLYEHDVLAWSEHQAELLRRLGRGERANDVDWANLAEEIEGVGLSELHSVESLLYHGECQGSCRLSSVMTPPIVEAAVLAAQMSRATNL
jgi:hypothetical protein